MEGCDEDQAKSKVEAHPLLELCVSSGDHGGFGRFMRRIFTAYERLVDATSHRMGDEKEGKVGNVVAEAGILRVGVVLIIEAGLANGALSAVWKLKTHD